jgi:predicted acyltransferase
VRRAVIIYLLGLVVNSAPFFRLSTMRYYGVLPRIALCYLIVASLYIWIRRPAGSAGGQPLVADKVGLLVACLLGYYLLMRFVPVPGFGVPGRDIPFLDHDANIVAWLDRQIFSARHLYEHTRDPEGLISTIPALGTTLMGVLTGLFLRTSRPDSRKALTLAIAGASSVLLGLIWNPWFPLNKKLWTSSFVLYAAGWSLLILAAFWFLVQVRNYRRGTWILLVFGTNAITAYAISELMADCLDKVRVGPHSNVLRWTAEHIAAVMPAWPALGSLAYSLLYVLVCWLLVLPLYRKKIFIKI